MVADLLFGGSSQSQTSKPPSFVTNAQKKMFELAGDIASQPYQPYTGARVAGLTKNQKAGISQAAQGSGGDAMIQGGYDLANRVGNKSYEQGAKKYLKDIRGAYDLAERAGNARWTSQAAQNYMNPFIDQALDPVIRRINEEAQQNAIGGRAGMIGQGGVGAFGDARTAVMEGEMEEARLRGVGDTLGAGYANAYDRALAEWGATQGRRLQAAGVMGEQGSRMLSGWEGTQDRKLRSADLMGTQGGRMQAVHSQGLSDLMATGALKQGQNQRSLDTAYGDFLEQRDWNMRGLDAYTRALSGSPYETQTSGNTGPSVAQQAVGLGVTGVGLWNLFS